MWVKVDDAFPEHRKVNEAGRHLGAHGRGRVIAIWTVALCYCNRNLTDGFVDEQTMRSWTLYDRKPMDVATVMAMPMPNGDNGLFVAVTGGFQFHDYQHYQPSSAEQKAKRQRDRDRKRRPLESDGNSVGIHADSTRNPERSRGRDPDPSRPVPDLRKDHRGSRREFPTPVENLRVLKALVWRETHAAFDDKAEDYSLSSVTERLKCCAAKAGLVYDVELFHRQIDHAFARVPLFRRRTA